MRSVLREPLVHFLLLGTALFLLFRAVGRDPGNGAQQIVVDRSRAQAIASEFERVWQRPPSKDERRGLIESWIREQVLYREGLAAGLDRDDQVVRRRVVQKMSVIAESLAAELPSDAELEEWLRTHPEKYRLPPRVSFRQIFVDPSRRGGGEGARRKAEELLAALRAGREADAGDPTMLPSELTNATPSEVERAFGEGFTAAVSRIDPGAWHGPVRSGFGWHVVRISERSPGRTPKLAEVRKSVERDVMRVQTEKAAEAFYEAARKRYDIRIEPGVAEGT